MSGKPKSLLVAIAAGALLLVGLALDGTAFFQSYLMGFMLVVGFPLGCMGVLMIHNLTGGNWGLPIRRFLEAGVRTLPLAGLLFLPLLGGLGHLYHWSHADEVAKDAVLSHKAPYLNVGFWIVRGLFYFALWIVWSRVLLKANARYEETGAEEDRRRRNLFSSGGLVMYVLSMTFAAVDWGMSIEAHWFSTIYGVMWIVGHVLGAYGLAILCACRDAEAADADKSRLNDLGNLLLAFVMLWAYIALSQFLIIWSGNLPEETPFYLRRSAGAWKGISIFLIVFHFFVPFLLLMRRENKRKADILRKIAVAVIAMRFIDVYWMIAPAFNHDPHEGFHFRWTDPVALIALGALWLWAFGVQASRQPPAPEAEPPGENEIQEAPAS